MSALIVSLHAVATRAWRSAFGDPRLALIAIVCLGVALRLSEVASRDLWADEAYSVQIAKSGLLGIVDKSVSDTHPPLYYLILHYWISLFGDSEFAVRALSIVVGAATVFLVYELGRLLASAKAGLLAALLVALSTFHLNYSIEARMYGMLALLTAASFYFFIALLRSSCWRAWLGYFAASTALIYTHVYGLFIIIAQNAFVLTYLVVSRAPLERWKTAYKRWAPLQLLLIGAFTPWIIVMIRQVEEELEGTAAAKLDPEVFPVPPVSWLLDTFLYYAGGRAGLALLVLLCLIAVGTHVYLPFRRNRTRAPAGSSLRGSQSPVNAPILLLSLWLVTPIALPFIVSHVLTPIYYFRQTIGASVAFFLLAAILLTRVPGRTFFAVSACFLVLSASYYLYRYQPFNIQGWSTVAAVIDNRANTGDLIVFDSVPARDAFNYYSERENLFQEFVVRRTTSSRIKQLAVVEKQHPRAWLITAQGLTIGERLRRELNRSYDEGYRLGPSPPFNGLDLTFFAASGRAR